MNADVTIQQRPYSAAFLCQDLDHRGIRLVLVSNEVLPCAHPGGFLRFLQPSPARPHLLPQWPALPMRLRHGPGLGAADVRAGVAAAPGGTPAPAANASSGAAAYAHLHPDDRS